MKIYRKLILGFSAISLSVALLGAIVFTLSEDAKHYLRQASESSALEANLASEMMYTLQQAHIETINAIRASSDKPEKTRTNTEGNFDRARNDLKRFLVLLNQARNATQLGLRFAEIESNEGEKNKLEILENVSSGFAEYRKYLHEIERVVRTENSEIEAGLLEPFDHGFRNVLNLVRSYQKDAEKELQDEADEVVETMDSMETNVVIVTGILILTAVGLGLIFSRRIADSLDLLKQATVAASEGRYDTRTDISSGDELEELGTAFNQMLAKIEKSQNELILQKEKAKRSDQAKTFFLGNMSHEIRTPLNAIMGYSQLLRMYDDNSREEEEEYLRNIEFSGRRLLETVNNVLELSKIESGDMSPGETDIELEELVLDVCQMYLPQADEKNIDYRYGVSSEMPRIVRGDRDMLSRILINLISNALKYTPEKGSVEIRVEQAGSEIAFRVIDTGIGVPEERRETIFEPFEQADNSSSRQFEGTGLGLALASKYVRLLKGRIFVENNPKGGSKFTVLTPLKEPSGTPATKSEAADALPKDRVVLMIEDNAMNRAFSEALFEELGLDLHLAENGKEGFEKAVELKPDLILMDIRMPVMDGFETSKRLREMPEFRETPIVALSADVFAESQQKALEKGVDDYLIKPLEIDTLLPVLKKYLKN